MSTASINLEPGSGLPVIPVRDSPQSPARLDRAWPRAFTLIELLTVISIIGVLAALTVGLTGLATRKSKESRVRTELTKLNTAIENYKSTVGSYPPDHPGFPSPNQLYYELSGTIYTNNQFYIPGRSEGFPAAATISALFGTSGFANAARDPRDLKFNEDFKASQFKRIKASVPVDVLAVPVKGPVMRARPGVDGIAVNPWLYVSTSPTNNPDRFDLWTEVVINGKLMRFSNWEKDPVVLSP